MSNLAFLRSRRQRQGKPAGDGLGESVLRLLAQHDLAPSPDNYALLYQYLSEPTSLIARAIDAVLIAGDPLDEAKLDTIARDMAASADRRAPQGDERSELRYQARQLAEVTADAADANERFGRGLATDLDGISHSRDQLSVQVQQMIERTELTEQQLASALEKIATLREEVEAERGNAGRDALTGLLNRRGMQPSLDALSPRDALVIIDLDHFKAINDQHGHLVGDRVLKLVARALQDGFDGQSVARWGGEEFLVVLKKTSLRDALNMADEARISLHEKRLRLRETDELIGNVSLSAGVALVGKDGIEAALQLADEALYNAKQNGRNRVETASAG